MSQQLPALESIELDRERVTRIKRNVLVAMLDNPTLLTSYAGNVVEEQNQSLAYSAIVSGAQLSEIIHELIKLLEQSEQYFKPKKYNFLQRWMGVDIEQQANGLQSLQYVERLTQNASTLSQRISAEIYQSQQQMQKLQQLRADMAHYVKAAEEFVRECDDFAGAHTPLNNFKDRLEKKINTLLTSQTATDLAMLQIRLSQNNAMTLLDRFNEAKNVLIPAWRQHVVSIQNAQTPMQLEQLNAARNRLVNTLNTAITENNGRPQ